MTLRLALDPTLRAVTTQETMFGPLEGGYIGVLDWHTDGVTPPAVSVLNAALTPVWTATLYAETDVRDLAASRGDGTHWLIVGGAGDHAQQLTWDPATRTGSLSAVAVTGDPTTYNPDLGAVYQQGGPAGWLGGTTWAIPSLWHIAIGGRSLAVAIVDVAAGTTTWRTAWGSQVDAHFGPDPFPFAGRYILDTDTFGAASWGDPGGGRRAVVAHVSAQMMADVSTTIARAVVLTVDAAGDLSVLANVNLGAPSASGRGPLQVADGLVTVAASVDTLAVVAATGTATVSTDPTLRSPAHAAHPDPADGTAVLTTFVTSSYRTVTRWRVGAGPDPQLTPDQVGTWQNSTDRYVRPGDVFDHRLALSPAEEVGFASAHVGSGTYRLTPTGDSARVRQRQRDDGLQRGSVVARTARSSASSRQRSLRSAAKNTYT